MDLWFVAESPDLRCWTRNSNSSLTSTTSNPCCLGSQNAAELLLPPREWAQVGASHRHAAEMHRVVWRIKGFNGGMSSEIHSRALWSHCCHKKYLPAFSMVCLCLLIWFIYIYIYWFKPVVCIRFTGCCAAASEVARIANTLEARCFYRQISFFCG